MKFLANSVLKGHKGISLTINPTDDDEVELTVRRLLMFSASTMECETTQEWRKVAEIIDSLEEEDSSGQDYVAIENDHWDMINKRLKEILPRVYRIHSPFVVDEIESLVAAGKPKIKKGGN